VRAAFYEYNFSDGTQKGIWWKRRLIGLYFPAVHLKGN
jgi:hypothetical protein